MEREQFGKYLQYAAGEIILVVIGILIALTLNNLNVDRINQQKLKNNVTILIENLQRDSLQIVRNQGRINQDRATLESYKSRSTDPLATIDTLIKIARDEYSPTMAVIEFTNKSVYNTMVQSGEINLFEKELLQDIYALYNFQDRVERRSEDSYTIYLAATNQYKNSYTFKNSNDIVSHGPLYQKIWEEVDEADFIAKFNAMASGKLLNYQQTELGLVRIQESINELLPKLRVLLAD